MINPKPSNYIAKKDPLRHSDDCQRYEAAVQVLFPLSYVIDHDRLCQWQFPSRAISGGITSIDTPCNAIELDVEPRDLLLLTDLKQIESLDRQLLASDGGEAPVPDDIVTGYENLDGFGTIESRSIEHAFDVLLFVVSRCGAEWEAGQDIDGI